MKHKVALIILFFVEGLFLPLKSQSLPVGTPALEDAVRQDQLIGKFDESVSFVIRPLYPKFHSDSMVTDKWRLRVRPMPFIWKQHYNSDHPEGLNDGVMIPARGYQTMISGGVYAKFGLFSIQLMPELVYAENRNFQGFPDELSDEIWTSYNSFVTNGIDIPEQFGSGVKTFINWGQSSFRILLDPISIGISNENIWWGPGIKNSILMTNNAPGFKHVSINSVRPIKTFLGSFESQIVAGKLDASGFPSIETSRLAIHGITHSSKPKDWRYINGLVLTYQPKWMPGLFLGGSRSFICYHNELGSNLNDYLPVIIPLLKKELNSAGEDAISRDQIASVFLRWLQPESHSEIYVEYGREDHNYDLTDLLLEPDHLRAYIVGFRKLTPLKNKNGEYFDTQVEITQFGKNLSSSYRYKGASGWYTHRLVRDGYTNNGQYLGAGIGTSSNMQSASIAWVKGMKRVGLDFKRVAHDENFWAYVSKDYRTHWVDIGGALIGGWDFGNLLINARLETIGSINYQHLYAPIPSDPAYWWDHGPIRYNVHAELGITYLFNR